MSDSDNETDETREHSTDDSGRDGFDRRTFLGSLSTAGALGAVGTGGIAADIAAAQEGDGWSPEPPQMETPWTDDVGPDNAHPEYPRPQMVREQWRNLNGVWGFAGAVPDDEPPIDQQLGEDILVPYPVESGLSGIKRHETWMWYRREFDVPDDWVVPTATADDGDYNNPNAQRLLLHFERVDWAATVYVNGQAVTTHEGGYDHFVADVTDALVEGGPQEVVVGVYDPTGADAEPVGTQPKGRQGVGSGYKGEDTLAMTPSSGIWDTVWIEPVPEAGHIEGLDVTPDLDAEVLRLTATATTDDATVVATAYEGDDKVGRVVGSPNEELELPVPDPHLWSPDDPHLYDLTVNLRRVDGGDSTREAGGGKLLDSVESYFGMRSLGLRSVGGVARPTLNGETVWQIGSLESGQWPDGLYTAPTDEALRANLQYQKELGYNMTRKHVKVETRRWFYHTDTLGLLVWQDMPNMHEYFDTPPREEAVLEHFKAELSAVVTEHDNHPSMAVWIPINEGWGIHNTNQDYVRELVDLIHDLDPERLVDPNSGFDVGSNQDSGAGEVKDVHQYGDPWYQIPEPEPDRVSALGEYTSPSLVLEDHKWGQCDSDITPETFVDVYVDRVESLSEFMVSEGLSASVYTATTGLENVCNGIITYDRDVIKPALAENGMERVRQAHESIIEKSKVAMSNVAIDVETPSSYVAGELLGNPKPFEVTVVVSNPESSADEALPVQNVTTSVSGGIPEDWSITGETTSFGTVADGESATATWEVTPDATADGDVSFDVTVDYELDGNSYSHDVTRTVSAAQLAYYRFENSPADNSSYDNDLALGGGASFDDDNALEADYSLALDGEDDYARISGQGSGSLHDAFTERSISMWIDPDDTSGEQLLYNEGGYFNGMGVRINDGSIDVILANTGDKPSISAPFTATEWTHVVVVFEAGALRLYLDGEEVAAAADVGFDSVPSHVAGSELGANTTTTPWQYDEADMGQYFGGNIDATAVYNIALTEAEIEAIGTRSFSVSAPDLYTAGEEAAPVTVAATFSDLREGDDATFANLSMRVAEIPEGWTATARTDTSFDAVPDGGFVTAKWVVTPAADAEGEAEIEIAVDYETDGAQQTLVDGTRLETLNSAAEALWRFNDSVEDSSGNGHTASLVDGASFDGQVVIEGSHSVALGGDSDYVDLAGPQEFLSDGFSTRTVATWVKPASTDGSQVIYNQGAGVSGMAIRITDGTLQAGTVSNGDQATVSTPFTATEWTHVAVVFENGVLRLYVNGELAAENTAVGYETVSGAYWGGELGAAEQSFWTGNFDGNVDLTAIYPFALSEAQIASLSGAY